MNQADRRSWIELLEGAKARIGLTCCERAFLRLLRSLESDERPPVGFIAVPFTQRVTAHRFETGPARRPAVMHTEGQLRAAYEPTEETDEP